MVLLIRRVLLLLILWCFGVDCLGQGNVVSTQELVRQWLTLEQQKGSMLESFQAKKEALELQITLLELEESSLLQLVDKLDSNTDEVELERINLIERQNQLEINQTALQKWLKASTVELNLITPKLPPPLQSVWQDNLTYINEHSNTVSERFERLLSTLDLFYEFNDRIAIHESAILVEGSQQVLVKQIYLGASTAWYVSNDGTYYGYGSVHNHRWKWWHGKETQDILGTPLSPQSVREIIGIIENPASFTLANLPVALEKLVGSRVE